MVNRVRPILFSGAMVRAILDGRKTQTRRVVKRIPWLPGANQKFSQARAFDNAGEWRIAGSEELTAGFRCPYGQPGGRLWVRESFTDLRGTGIEHRPDPRGPLQRYAYSADTLPGSASDEARKDFGIKWRPSIHMPREACRLVLEITDVRVQRLQNISDQDVQAEGFLVRDGEDAFNVYGEREFYLPEQLDPGHKHYPKPGGNVSAQQAFRRLWTETGGDWDANPWVWALSFRRAEHTHG